MLKKQTTLLCCLIVIYIQADQKEYRKVTGSTILTSTLLKWIDGKSIGIHSETMRAILVIRTRLLHMLYGKVKAQGMREGMYSFDGQRYTIDQLCKLEMKRTIDKQTLQLWLEDIKADFSSQITPFLELGRGFKPQMLILIEESLRLHRRGNSILRMWAEEKEGEDMVAFETKVKSFDDLARFLYDLINFLDDLVASCPKARAQFIEHLKSDKEKKIYIQRFEKLFERQKNKINSYNQQ